MAIEDWTTKDSSLCSLGPRPQIMTGLFLTLLREHYASADNIEHAVFRERLYTEVSGSEDTTGVMIEDSTVWTPTRTENRPAIIVRRDGWQHLKRLTFDSSSGVDSSGRLHYAKLWRGSHTLFCISPSGAETEILTAETYRFLMHFGPVFRRSFGLHMFELLSVGPLSQVEEASKHYAVPITVAYGWDESWLIREHVPPLRDVRLSQIFETYRGS